MTVIKKFGFAGLCMLLTSCDQNIAATIYARDAFELLDADKELPIDINIEILETGISQQCAKPEGKQIVEAVASVFQKASLVGCEKITGSMNDRMVIKATTVVTHSKSTDVTPGPNLVHFDIHKGDGPDTAFIVARFNSTKYGELKRKLTAVNMMAQIRIEKARMTITVNNDERTPISVVSHLGNFANGEPVDNTNEYKLMPRQEVTLKLGDVKTAFLAANGWAGVANVKNIKQ